LHRLNTFACGATLFTSALLIAGCGSAQAPAGPATASAKTSGAAATAAAATTPATPAPATPAPATATPTAAPDAAGTATMTACTVITEDDATTLLGSDPGPGVEHSDGPISACAYGDLQIGMEQGPAMKTLFDSLKSARGTTPGYASVDGVGDDGFLVLSPDHDTLLYILKGSTLVSAIVVTDPNITAVTLTALGASAAARL
jgi:hypothetical protein